jgi:acyl carrier protein
MGIDDFINDFRELFEESDSSGFNSSTKFRDTEEWSSLVALSVIAMVDDKYRVKISGDELREIQTIGEIFSLIQKKHAALSEGLRK